MCLRLYSNRAVSKDIGLRIVLAVNVPVIYIFERKAIILFIATEKVIGVNVRTTKYGTSESCN
jgi:hypothetical protein